MSDAGAKLKLTEIPNAPPELPALYIYCNFGQPMLPSSRTKIMNDVLATFRNRLPDHHIVVGDVDLKFAYIAPQEAVYHELKQDHRSTA